MSPMLTVIAPIVFIVAIICQSVINEVDRQYELKYELNTCIGYYLKFDDTSKCGYIIKFW